MMEDSVCQKCGRGFKETKVRFRGTPPLETTLIACGCRTYYHDTKLIREGIHEGPRDSGNGNPESADRGPG